MAADRPERLTEGHSSQRAEPLLVDMSLRHDLNAGRNIAPPAEPAFMQALNGKFDQVLKKMTDDNHHWDTLPWLQNLSEDRKCYSQANEMGQALRRWIAQTPGLKGNFSVKEGTINEGKGADPRDFYSGNGEHNFIVLTNLKDGTKYYGDPWSGRNFSKDPQKSVHNFKNQKIWEHDF